jgi:hypothetical protein
MKRSIPSTLFETGWATNNQPEANKNPSGFKNTRRVINIYYI